MNAPVAADDPGREARHAATALRDLPDSLWPGLMEALRRTFDDLDPSVIPRRLRPFVSWHPDRLDRRAVRAAVIASLPGDARLRRALADQVAEAEPDLASAVRNADVERLADAFEPGAVAAALVGAERWDALEVLSARQAERERPERAADAPQPVRARASSDTTTDEEMRRRDRDIRELRQELDRADRRGDALSRTVSELRGAVAEAERERDTLAAELDRVRSRHRERLARLRRQARRAREQAADREERVHVLADELRTMLDGLTGHARGAGAEEAGDDVAPEAAAAAGSQTPVDAVADATGTGPAASVPRGVRAAGSGRPCRLPPGVAAESGVAVVSLLQVRGLELLVDGYNVTKDLRGRPSAPLAQQRRWLVRTIAGLCALYPVRPTVVFDGDAPGRALPSPRGVRTVFTRGDETADDRIMGYVERMAPDVPVLVVTSDREIRDHAAQRGANVVSSTTFLQGIGVAA